MGQARVKGSNWTTWPDKGVETVIMSAKAKQERDDMEMKLVAMKLAIEDLCSATTPTKRLVKKRRKDMRVIWEKLITKHVLYCRSAGVGMESPESVEFLKKVGRIYNEAELVVTDVTADEVIVRRLKKRVK